MATVFFTGFPGFLGSELVPRVLARRSDDRARCAARTTCSTISPGVRWRVNPAWPVAQNPQPIAHPAWLETHSVARL